MDFSYIWNTYEAAYLTTQIFVALGTVLLSVFSSMVTYKAYKDNNVSNWLNLEFAYFTDNLENGQISLLMNLRNSGKIPLKISSSVVFFLSNSKILDNISFAPPSEMQEVNMMEMKAVYMSPAKIKNTAGELVTSFNIDDLYASKIKHLDLDKIKRIRIGVVSNVKYHKYDLSEEELFYIIKYLKELKHTMHKKELKKVAAKAAKEASKEVVSEKA